MYFLMSGLFLVLSMLCSCAGKRDRGDRQEEFQNRGLVRRVKKNMELLRDGANIERAIMMDLEAGGKDLSDIFITVTKCP